MQHPPLPALISTPVHTLTPDLAKPAVAGSQVPNWLLNLPLILIHLTPLAILFVGVDMLSLGICLASYLLQMFGITAGYHRYFSHRSFKTSRVFQFVLGWLGCLALEKGPIWWTAHHRHHHRHSDRDDDVHSPVTHSIWWSHLGWLFNEKAQMADLATVKDLNRHAELRWLNAYYWIPALLLGVVFYWLNGWSGVVWGSGVATVLSLHAVFLVNSACHLWGSRRFATPDASRNNAIVAILTLGEGWHNNHHHCQSSVRQGVRWWEIDMTYYTLRLLSFFSIVWDLRYHPASKGATTASTAN